MWKLRTRDNMSVCTLLQGVRALETPWKFLLVKRWMVRQRHMRVDRVKSIGITQHFRRFHYNQENVIKRQQESAWECVSSLCGPVDQISIKDWGMRRKSLRLWLRSREKCKKFSTISENRLRRCSKLLVSGIFSNYKFAQDSTVSVPYDRTMSATKG